jgi:hypothetical protein
MSPTVYSFSDSQRNRLESQFFVKPNSARRQHCCRRRRQRCHGVFALAHDPAVRPGAQPDPGAGSGERSTAATAAEAGSCCPKWHNSFSSGVNAKNAVFCHIFSLNHPQKCQINQKCFLKEILKTFRIPKPVFSTIWPVGILGIYCFN